MYVAENFIQLQTINHKADTRNLLTIDYFKLAGPLVVDQVNILIITIDYPDDIPKIGLIIRDKLHLKFQVEIFGKTQ